MAEDIEVLQKLVEEYKIPGTNAKERLERTREAFASSEGSVAILGTTGAGKVSRAFVLHLFIIQPFLSYTCRNF